MKSLNKWWFWLLLSLVLLSLAVWHVLDSVTYDNVPKISAALLFKPNDRLNETAFAGAMNARFPRGTRPGELIGFVKSLNGQCSTEKDSKFRCELPEEGTLCIAGKIGLNVQLDPDHNVQPIGVKGYVIGC